MGTVTATWNNTAAGDNNLDTISGATVNFTQSWRRRGGSNQQQRHLDGHLHHRQAAVAATNLNVAVTVIDNA